MSRYIRRICVYAWLGVIILSLWALFVVFSGQPDVSIVVLPHHGITGNNIENFYKDLSKKEMHFDTVFVISPDHFWLTTANAESLPKGDQKICYRDICGTATSLIGYESKNSKQLYPKHASIIEHGLGEHIQRIVRYFPESTIVPLVVKRENHVTDLGRKIAKDILYFSKHKKTLVVISVDFSHHVPEPFAQLHDQKSINTLSWGETRDFDTLEVDCRNCLFIGKEIAKKVWKPYIKIWGRTSVESISGEKVGTQNTSHVFGTFVSERIWSPGALFLFAGDTHWWRDFDKNQKTKPLLFERIMRIFYQENDISKTPSTWYHRILSGFDGVVVNFESTIADTHTCLEDGKKIQIITKEENIKKLADIGINTVNIANNHTRDCGENIFQKMYDLFPKYGIDVVGENHDFIKTIYGKKYAFVSINTIEQKYDIDSSINRIHKYSAKKIPVIVNIHWWHEYEKKHTPEQEAIAHRLIDAGARLIIGHHPHVVQEEGYYRGVPIYYSLGNFVFDETSPKTEEWWLVWCDISESHTSCQKVSIYRWRDLTLGWKSQY